METKDYRPLSHRKDNERIEKALGEPVRENSVHNLGLSRCLGDFDVKRKSIATPETNVWDFTVLRPKFLILASDGVWDEVDSERAVQVVFRYFNTEPDFGAKKLALEA